MLTFCVVPENISFPRVEEEFVLKFWKEIDAFQTSVKVTAFCPLVLS